MTSPFDKYKFQVDIAKAMAFPSRMMILDILLEEELCVAELTKRIDMDRTTVSKNLSILKNAGLVQTRREGTTIYYKATYSYIRDVIESLTCMVRENIAKYQAVSDLIQPPKESPPQKKS